MSTETATLEAETKISEGLKPINTLILITVANGNLKVGVPFEFLGKEESDAEKFMRKLGAIMNFPGPRSRAKKKPDADIPRLGIEYVDFSLVGQELIYIGPTINQRQDLEALKKRYSGIETLLEGEKYKVLGV